MQGGRREEIYEFDIYEFAVTAMALAYSPRFFRLRITMNGKREILERFTRGIDVTLAEILSRSKRISDDIVRFRRVSPLVLSSGPLVLSLVLVDNYRGSSKQCHARVQAH